MILIAGATFGMMIGFGLRGLIDSKAEKEPK
jgi:hypothetical protein